MTNQVGTTTSNEEKIWEKPWSYNEMKAQSTTWSLAGDSGLLLNLKQFSENLISKSVEIEKKLQQLNHSEQQCLAKFNNVTSSFLLLENTQFIENRVYDHDLNEPQLKETKKEKTKEEKELDLFNKINEAVNVGMSIMDTYFEKLDPKQSNSDDDDDEDSNQNMNTDQNDMFIYETKDPYVLRSLPYLIGSQQFLDNDHVGLKDLDSEDEIEEEDDEEEEDEHTDDKQKNESENNSPIFSVSDQNKNKKSDIETDSSVNEDNDNDDDDDDDDDDLFKPKTATKKDNLFDDDSTSQSEKEEEKEQISKLVNEEPKIEKKAPLDFASELSARLTNKQKPTNTVQKDSDIKISPKPSPKPQVKTSNLFDSEEEDEEENQIFKSTKTVAKTLFDDENEEEEEKENDLFSKSKPKIIEIEPAPKSTTMPKSELTSALNDLFAQKMKPKQSNETDDVNTLFSDNNKPDVKQPSKTNQVPAKSKFSLFDTDDDEEESDDFLVKKSEPANVIVKPQPTVIKPPVKSLFSDDDEENSSDFLIKKTEPVPAPVLSKQQQTVSKPANKNLFSDDDEDLFSKPSPTANVKSTTEITTTKKATSNNLFESTDSSLDEKRTTTEINKQVKPNSNASTKFFESSEESSTSPDLFSSTKITYNKQNEFLDEAKDLMPELKNNNETIINKPDKINLTKQSLFDSSTEDEESDSLFKITTNNKPAVPSIKQQQTEAIKKDKEITDLFASMGTSSLESSSKKNTDKPLFEEEKDFLISSSSKINENVGIIKKKNIFGEDSDEEDDNDLFKTKKEPLSTSKSIKEPLESIIKQDEPKQQPITKNEPLVESIIELEKTTPSKPASKPVGGKNLLFNPAALKNSNLFKKLAVQSKTSDDDENEDENKTKVLPKQIDDEIKTDEKNENIDNFFQPPTLTNSMEKSKLKVDPLPLSSTNQVDDIFTNLSVDRAFSDSSLKNAQKDRIKATSGKKRSPIIRKPIQTNENNQFDKPLTVKETKSDIKEIIEPIIEKKNEPVKQTETAAKSNSLLLNFEQQKTTSRKSLENIFDGGDEDEIFSVKKTAKEQKESIKSKTTEPFKSDEFDLFSSPTSNLSKNKKKNDTKILDDIFADDDTDIFSDMAKLKDNKKKQVDVKKPPNESVKISKPLVNKKDLFQDISDEDDIFSGVSTKSNKVTKKKDDNTSKNKTDDFDDPLNLFKA